jgi:hypothetical protein
VSSSGMTASTSTATTKLCVRTKRVAELVYPRFSYLYLIKEIQQQFPTLQAKDSLPFENAGLFQPLGRMLSHDVLLFRDKTANRVNQLPLQGRFRRGRIRCRLSDGGGVHNIGSAILPGHAGRIARDDRVRRYILRHEGTARNPTALANGYTSNDNGMRPDPHLVLQDGEFHHMSALGPESVAPAQRDSMK